jgi:hypothetical protein
MQTGAAGRYADTVYDRNAPGQQGAGEAYVSSSGYSSNEERLVSEALASQLALDPATIRAIRPGFAKQPLFPPRFGYAQVEIGIHDVIEVDRRYPDSSSQFSGSAGGYSGSSTPSLGWW